MTQERLWGQKFTLSGELKGRDTGILVLNYDLKRDTVFLNNGKFSFSGFIQGPVVASLSGDVKSASVDDPNFTFIFLEPKNMTGVLTENDFRHRQIKGSHTEEELEQYSTNEVEPIRNQLKHLREERTKANSEIKSAASQAKLDSIQVKYDWCLSQLKTIPYKFVASNPHSFLSPFLLSFYQNDDVSLDSVKYFYQKFSPTVKNSYWGKYVSNALRDDELATPGNIAPGFTTTDVNGKVIMLSSFRGKSFVLLDFWASWCVPCREMIPHLKELLQKYQPKGFTIISISADIDSAIWRKAVRKDSIQNWNNILNTELVAKYGISVYPTLILINREGYIIGRYVGFSEDNSESDLDKKLNEIFK